VAAASSTMTTGELRYSAISLCSTVGLTKKKKRPVSKTHRCYRNRVPSAAKMEWRAGARTGAKAQEREILQVLECRPANQRVR
jgi:hypothetical protein